MTAHNDQFLEYLRQIGLYRESLICFDCETTGLKPYEDEILTFSAVDGHGNVLIDAMFKPENAESWPRAEAINGISPEMVSGCPSFESRREEIQKLFDTHYMLLGYNIRFDIGFLDAAGIEFKALPKPEGWPYDRYERELMHDFSAYIAGLLQESVNYSDYLAEHSGHKRVRWQKLTTAADYIGYQWEGRAHGSLADAKAALAVAEWLYCGEKRD